MPDPIAIAGTEEWHKLRRGAVTSTDVPAILGVPSKGGKTAYGVWARITGKLADDEVANGGLQKILEWGLATEEMNARWYEKRKPGRSVTRTQELYRDAEFPWLLCTPDGIVTDAERGLGTWEAKAPTPFTRHDWDEGQTPLAYVVQVQVAMRVLVRPWASVSAIVQPELEIRDHERDDSFQSAMMEALIDFWLNRVQKDIPPPMTAGDSDVLRRVFPRDVGTEAPMTDELALAAREYAVAHDAVKAAQDEKDRLGNIIRASMKDASEARGQGWRITWKAFEKAGYTVKPSTQRPLSVKPLT